MDDMDALGARIDDIVDRRELVGLAVAVVGPDGLRLFRGHGTADRDAGAPIDQRTVFRIASITKTFTAIAVMQLVEAGRLELDAPANDYLRELRLVPARPRHAPATLRQLLSHTAGVGELAHLSGLVRPDFGESVPAGEPLPRVVDFYGGRIRLKAEPGTRFTYGNHSPMVLGQVVEDVTGTSLDVVFRERVFDPLGMHDSDLARSEAVREHLATGYRIGRRGPQAVEERDMVTAAAASVYSTPADMARYAAALLAGGANQHGRILRADTLAQMFAPQFRPDPRIPGMGLGFFRAELDGHHVVEHQGVHPGFDSHMCLAPEDGVGVVMFTNGARDAMLWLSTEADELLATSIGIPAARRSAVTPRRPASSAELVGWYRLDGPWSDLRKRIFMGAGVEVTERDGQTRLRFLTVIPDLVRGYPLVPDDEADPDVYRVELGDAGSSRVVFARGRDGAVRSIVLGMMPIELHRRPPITNPRRWLIGAAAAIAIGIGVMALRTTTRPTAPG